VASLKVSKRKSDGVHPALVERRKEVFALRARGYSVRGIADAVNLSRQQVSMDLEWACKQWGGHPENGRDAIRGEMVEVLRQATALVLKDAEKQAKQGISVTTLDERGQVIQKQVKDQVDPRTVAELGRCCERDQFARPIHRCRTQRTGHIAGHRP
jgi:hypothetical protein